MNTTRSIVKAPLIHVFTAMDRLMAFHMWTGSIMNVLIHPPVRKASRNLRKFDGQILTSSRFYMPDSSYEYIDSCSFHVKLPGEINSTTVSCPSMSLLYTFLR